MIEKDIKRSESWEKIYKIIDQLQLIDGDGSDSVDKPSVVTELEELLKETSNDDYIRLYAEFENFKKRVAKEKQELITSTKISMLNSILEMDNDLSIAMKNIDDELKEGLSLIVKKLGDFLISQGIEEIQTETYDSELHEVISVLKEGSTNIVDVISKGYSLNGKPFKYPKIVLG